MSERDDRAKIEADVRSCYSTWASDYFKNYYADPKAYPPVHLDIIRKLLVDSGAKTLLDAGCGPASMLCGLLDMGLDLYGFDLTPEMVEVARQVVGDAGVPASHVWEGSVAERPHFHQAGVTPAAYDATICMGVFPHLSETIENKAIANLHSALKPGGTVAIEARNQLFALFTLNRYSFDLFCSELVRVPALRERVSDRASLDTVLEQMKERFRMDLPPIRGGKAGEPGYDQVLSRTHNPFELRKKVEEAGFRNVEVLFYHYHCLPPMFEHAMPEEFRKQSVAMEDPRDWRGHFMASAFIVTGVRG
jgi:2-polyprenyl-3-methyl-5-hydroxy-6-metoxy-1,4-benzoquinol methylase